MTTDTLDTITCSRSEMIAEIKRELAMRRKVWQRSRAREQKLEADGATGVVIFADDNHNYQYRVLYNTWRLLEIMEDKNFERIKEASKPLQTLF
jgi:hypothetical protein